MRRIVHPLNSAGSFDGEEADSRFVIDGSYLDESYYADTLERNGMHIELVSKHRPLQAYTGTLTACGFVVEVLQEPAIPEEQRTPERRRRWTRVPLFPARTKETT